jgi:TRAP-type transport system small permease protein
MTIDTHVELNDADGEFHAVDEAIDLSHTTVEAWIALALFWALGGVVFYQFVTRYVLNDSAAWTEEIARYLLIATVFIGAAIGVAKNNHIQVDLLYRYLPASLGKPMSMVVDVLRVGFFAWMSVLTVQMMQKVGGQNMSVIDWPIGILHGFCLFGLVMMTLRSAWVLWVHWRRGYSVLERPDSTMADR